jgi:hypothetical protein
VIEGNLRQSGPGRSYGGKVLLGGSAVRQYLRFQPGNDLAVQAPVVDAGGLLQAQVNHIRDKYGTTLLPRIVVHKPRRGDIYHLDKRLLTALWRWIPIAYRHGLKLIELKARTHDFVGRPYAYHHVRAKSICIYSCPPLDWPVTGRAYNSVMKRLANDA